MKRVVIGMKNGKPFVVSCPTKIEIVFREEKTRTFRRVLRTWSYNIRKKLGFIV
jgi:hypothetical protein